MTEFNVGDKVTWVPHSGWKSHSGIVVCVVSAGEEPHDALLRDYPGHMFHSQGVPRSHKSYIVEVGNKLYWPRVCQLRKDESHGRDGTRTD